VLLSFIVDIYIGVTKLFVTCSTHLISTQGSDHLSVDFYSMCVKNDKMAQCHSVRTKASVLF